MSISTEGNTVTFNFDEIFLSDSASNLEGSQGYITFSITPAANITPGTKLINKVTIIFDHYEAVETNETLNTIQSKQQEEEMIEVKTYPNPATDVLNFSLLHKQGKFTNKTIKLAELTDMYGRVVIRKAINSNSELRINLPQLLQGFFILKITDTENKVYSKKIMIGKGLL
jgi:hypothetical protein